VKTRILLADDHEILREGLRALLQKQSDVEIIGEARDGRAALEMSRDLKPDIVIMDIGMPGLNGIEATRQIKVEAPGVKVITLSMHAERRFVTGMLGAGASAYVLKSAALDELLDAVRAVRENRLYTSPEITDIVVQDYVDRMSRKDLQAGSPLTPREREVLQLIAEGLSSKEISSRLHVSSNTVDTHRRRIMEKLDLHTVAELTKYALREGLTSLND
jgi:two-component system response regulator NreC